MLSYKTIEPHTLELLKSLCSEEKLSQTRLVGSTALALQYGHRTSVDLDFFGSLPDDNEETKDILRNIGKFSVIKESTNIKIYLLDDIKIDFVNYRYKWIDKPIIEDGIRLASPKDIAAMKINAVEGRGTKKDFIDMYFLLHHYSMKEIIDFYIAKYPENSTFRALMSLSYFDDAEEQIMPKMFSDIFMGQYQILYSVINCELFQIKFSRHFLNRPASIRIVHKSESSLVKHIQHLILEILSFRYF